MSLDPERVGVWVPAYLVALAPGSNAALLLAQVTWLIQPDRSGDRRTDIVEQDGHEWIARTDEDWWWIGLDRSAAHRARQALQREGLILTAKGTAGGHKTTLLRPDLDRLLIARMRAIEDLEKRGYARTKARMRAPNSADARNDAVLIENTGKNLETRVDEPSADGPVAWKVPAVVTEAGLLDAAVELCEHWAERLDARGVRVDGKARSKAWVAPMEAMLRIDGREPEHVRRVIDWLEDGSDEVSAWWQANVLSPDKLRAKWDTLGQQYRRLKTEGAGRRSDRMAAIADLAREAERQAQ